MDIGQPQLKKVIRYHCQPSITIICSTAACVCRRYRLSCLPCCAGCQGEECTDCEVDSIFCRTTTFFVTLKFYFSKSNRKTRLLSKRNYKLTSEIKILNRGKKFLKLFSLSFFSVLSFFICFVLFFELVFFPNKTYRALYRTSGEFCTLDIKNIKN